MKFAIYGPFWFLGEGGRGFRAYSVWILLGLETTLSFQHQLGACSNIRSIQSFALRPSHPL
uniref:Uncharacterized protein n=1 Tax=Rhizophora mucronata TaxID=61149 RepID=A0A2P2JTE9_RHIMU